MAGSPAEPPPPAPPLALTGERTAPGIWHETYWFARHLAAYQLALPYCAGRRVLDAGCGEGYGPARLAAHAASVIGADLARDVMARAARAYPRPRHPGLRFVVAELGALPLSDRSVDVAVSFQVIEHLWDVRAYLAEMARVLTPGGLLLCSTPNRLTFTPDVHTPVNPFHVREFTARELRECLSEQFEVKTVLGVHHGPRLRAVERRTGRSMPELLLDRPPGQWPAWLADLVRTLSTVDFEIRGGNGRDDPRADTSLDLVVVARRG